VWPVDSTVIILIVVIVLLLLVLGAAGLMLSRRRRSERLQEHYGPEYERSVRETGDRRSAEAELTERERRLKDLDIRSLRPEERDRYRASWNTIQADFVDDPVKSVHAADRLVVDIMRTRGYPVDDFDRRAEDISVSHPDVVQHYRDARAVRDATDQGQVDTDQQRRAVTSYRSLVDALLGKDDHDSDRHDSDRHDSDRHDSDRHDSDRHDSDRHDSDRHDDDRRDADRSDDHRRTDDVRNGTDRRHTDGRANDPRYTDDHRTATNPQTEERTR
jgi:hypothetical protein